MKLAGAPCAIKKTFTTLRSCGERYSAALPAPSLESAGALDPQQGRFTLGQRVPSRLPNFDTQPKKSADPLIGGQRMPHAEGNAPRRTN